MRPWLTFVKSLVPFTVSSTLAWPVCVFGPNCTNCVCAAYEQARHSPKTTSWPALVARSRAASASGSGGLLGKQNGQYRHGERTKAAIADRQKFSALLKLRRWPDRA